MSNKIYETETDLDVLEARIYVAYQRCMTADSPRQYRRYYGHYKYLKAVERRLHKKLCSRF